MKRIYGSRVYIRGGEPLQTIWEDYADKFSLQSLRNHTKKHQFIDGKDFNKRHLENIAKKAEQNIIKKQIESKDVWDRVIEEGMLRLETGEISMKTADLLKAAKDKSDYDFKKKDQEMAMAEMIYFFASGENGDTNASRRYVEGETAKDNHTSSQLTGVDYQGKNGQDPIYHTITWDAITQGPGQIPPPEHT